MKKRLSCDSSREPLGKSIVSPPRTSSIALRSVTLASKPTSSLIPYGEPLRLESEFTELDRQFFLILDMDFSLYTLPAETGVHYVVECEDTFSFGHLLLAAQHFAYFKCNQELSAGTQVAAKYMDLGKLVASNILNEGQAKSITGRVKQEYELLYRWNCSQQRSLTVDASGVTGGLLEVYFIASRFAHVFYLFVEKWDESLAEFICRHCPTSSGSILSTTSTESETWKRHPKEPIPLKETLTILRLLSCTLLDLHQNGIVHGNLTANSVFIFRNHQQGIGSVKLGNFTFATILEKPQSEDSPEDGLDWVRTVSGLMDEVLRAKELLALQEIAFQLAARTGFPSIKMREHFYDIVSILDISREELADMEQEVAPELRTLSQVRCQLPSLSTVKWRDALVGIQVEGQKLAYFVQHILEELAG